MPLFLDDRGGLASTMRQGHPHGLRVSKPQAVTCCLSP